MKHRKGRGVGVLMLGVSIWLPAFGCGDNDDGEQPTGGTHQGGASTGGVVGRSGGVAGSAAGGEAQPGGTGGSAATGGLGNGGAGQGGTPETGGAGQAGAFAGDGGTAAGGKAAGDGGTSDGAAGNGQAGQAGEQGTGRVDCGGQSCDRCCYNPGIAPEIAKEFECDATLGSDVYLCGFRPRFEMTCDAKSDCREGLVCCMEEAKGALIAVAACFETCPAASSTWSHYELCANDEECTAPKQCLKIPGRYFRGCQ